MPKLDLRNAVRIKSAAGELAALKGAGFSWVRPAPAPVVTSAMVFGSGAVDPVDASSFTFAGQTFGVEAEDRYVVAVICWRAAASGTVTSALTIGGVSATRVLGARNATGGLFVTETAAYIALVPAGTTGSVAFTLTGTAGRAACAVYSLYGIDPTPIATATDVNQSSSMSGTLTLPDDAHVLAGAYFLNSATSQQHITTSSDDLEAGSPTITLSSTLDWAGLTEHFDAAIEAAGVANAAVFVAWAQVGAAPAMAMLSPTEGGVSFDQSGGADAVSTSPSSGGVTVDA